MRTMVLAAAVALALVGCGDSLGPGDEPGTGSVTATGAVNASGSGIALFQSVSSGGSNPFQILVAPLNQTAAPSWQLQIVSYSGRLATGTYALAPLSASSTDPTASFYVTTGGSMEMFNSSSGELVITSSSSTAVRGTFTFTATKVSGAGSVTAQGAFNAQCAPGIACN
jgi:hypothetical protein